MIRLYRPAPKVEESKLRFARKQWWNRRMRSCSRRLNSERASKFLLRNSSSKTWRNGKKLEFELQRFKISQKQIILRNWVNHSFWGLSFHFPPAAVPRPPPPPHIPTVSTQIGPPTFRISIGRPSPAFRSRLARSAECNRPPRNWAHSALGYCNPTSQPQIGGAEIAMKLSKEFCTFSLFYLTFVPPLTNSSMHCFANFICDPLSKTLIFCRVISRSDLSSFSKTKFAISQS